MEVVDKSYEMWKKRKRSSPKTVTIWGAIGVIIGLCLIFAYWKVGKEGKGFLIAVLTVIIDRIGELFIKTAEQSTASAADPFIFWGFLLVFVAFGIRVWAVFDARGVAQKFQRKFEEESSGNS